MVEKKKQKKKGNQPKQGYRATLSSFYNTKIKLRLNGGREIEGIVVGSDAYMNLVMDKAFQITKTDRKLINKAIIRGNSIQLWQMLERID